jgi:adenosylmethionine-8-amino-7-oxononanoate aminotransferase
MKILHSFANTFNTVASVDSSLGYYINCNNKSYLDFISGLYNCPLGSSEASIKYSISTALDQLPNSHLFAICPGLSQSNLYADKLTIRLQQLVPFGKSIIYTNSGAEAVEVGLKHCINFNGRKKIISYRNSYHGSTFLANEVSGNINTTLPNRIYVDFYDFNVSLSKQEYLDYIEHTILTNDPTTISCFIIEPMIGASGGFFMKENVLPEISKMCKQYGILLVLDEIISGFGRLGNMFAFEKYNIIPDVLLLSKQLTNGYMPLGACILSNRFEFDNVDIKMGSTTAGNPVSCAAAITSVQLLLQSDYARRYVEDQLDILTNTIIQHDKIYKIEHTGCFAALHFSQKKDELKLFDYNIGGEVAKLCYNKGLIIRGNPKSIILSPGYNINESQFKFATSTIMESLNELPI